MRAFKNVKSAPLRNIVLVYNSLIQLFTLREAFCWYLEARNFKILPIIAGLFSEKILSKLLV